MYVLGISPSHNCTASLLKDGRIIACAQEERFSRIKNHIGFPFAATEFVLKYAGIAPNELDLVAISFESPLRNLWTEPEIRSYYTKRGGPRFSYRIRSMRRKPVIGRLTDWALKSYYWYYEAFKNPRKKREQVQQISGFLSGIDEGKIASADHHLAHAFASYYGVAIARARECLVMTHDAFGDRTCSGIWRVQGDTFVPISSTPNNSTLAGLYGQVTLLLGMKSIEDEYKVMGLAPYTNPEVAPETYELFEPLVRVTDDLRFETSIDSEVFYDYLKERLVGHRFDRVASALQRLTEERLVEWVVRSIKRTGMTKIAVGGGVFMNVKANMELMYNTPLEELYVCPSAGDESTAIGASYWGYRLLCEKNGEKFDPRPLEDLYLGPEFEEEEISTEINSRLREKYRIERFDNIEEEIARLLVKGNVVARFSGRMEFGARALGNRSILADPSNRDIVEELNKQIKSRDFWMPFAPTILAEREHDYVLNPKLVQAPYMVLAFRTTALAQKELRACIHPYDKTCRPQVLDRFQNEPYHRLIREFERMTGIGAVLNTSFNLHGEPVVCSPADALSTLDRSGLAHLAIGSLLVSKNYTP